VEGEDLGLLGGGDEGGVGIAEEEVGGSEEEVEGGAESEGGEEPPPEEDGSSERSTPPSRTLPTDVRRAIRELSAAQPEFAKRYPTLERQVTAALFKAGQADKLGGIQALREASELLENHGGVDGIAGMAEEVQASRMMEEGFKAGDPVLVDTWAKEYPDGFKALVGHAIEKLEAVDLAAHDRALSGPMYKALDRCGVIGTITALETAIAGERYDEIQRHAGDLKQFLSELRNFATRAKAPDPLKGEREAFDREKQEFAGEQQKAFYGGIRSQVNTQVMGFTNQLLRQALAGKKIPIATGNRLRKAINEELATQVNTAPGYADKYKAVIGAGNSERAVHFIVAAARAKLPGVVKKLVREFNLTGSGNASSAGVRRVAASGRASGGGSTVTGRPKTSDVDFTRTDKASWLGSIAGHGEAWLKNGKKARW
jgi:hypothetical protein